MDFKTDGCAGCTHPISAFILHPSAFILRFILHPSSFILSKPSPLCSFQSVSHQHCYGQQADSSRYRCPPAGNFICFCGIDVTNEGITSPRNCIEPRLRLIPEQTPRECFIRNLIHADVDNGSSGLDMIAPDKARPPNRHHHEITLPRYVLEVLCS